MIDIYIYIVRKYKETRKTSVYSIKEVNVQHKWMVMKIREQHCNNLILEIGTSYSSFFLKEKKICLNVLVITIIFYFRLKKKEL